MDYLTLSEILSKQSVGGGDIDIKTEYTIEDYVNEFQTLIEGSNESDDSIINVEQESSSDSIIKEESSSESSLIDEDSIIPIESDYSDVNNLLKKYENLIK